MPGDISIVQRLTCRRQTWSHNHFLFVMVSTRSRRGRPLPPPVMRSNRPQYKPGDDCKRHRLPDRKPKNIQVTTYRRRKPS